MRVWGGLLKYSERGGRGEGSRVEVETDLGYRVCVAFCCRTLFECDALWRKSIVSNMELEKQPLRRPCTWHHLPSVRLRDVFTRLPGAEVKPRCLYPERRPCGAPAVVRASKICHPLNDNDSLAKTSELRRAIPDHCEGRILEYYAGIWRGEGKGGAGAE